MAPGGFIPEDRSTGTVYVTCAGGESQEPQEEKESDESPEEGEPEILDSNRRLSMPGEHRPFLRMLRGLTGPPLGDKGRSLAC